MCGISGIINFNSKAVQEADLQKMMLCQKHRGPDDQSTFINDNMGLGFVRLSILDLSMAGRQPMTDKSERYNIVFNGEIFNYVELKEELTEKGISFNSNTDTEVLLNMYILYGKECLHKLNGMFAFAIYDNVSKVFFAARDRYGVKPFYYYKSDEEFIFASEIPSILSVYKIKNELNERAVLDYLAFNRTDQNNTTFFKNIYKLQHGHCITIENNNVKIEKWYDLKTRIAANETKNDDYLSLLTDAIKIRMRSDVPVGVCLSGGLDSSSIASILVKKLGYNKIHTFSAIYEKHQRADESKFIDMLSPFLQNMHYVTPNNESLLKDLEHFVEIHAEPIPSTGPYAQYCVMRLAKNDVTVTLDGQGADEALAGYHYFYGFFFKDLLRKFKLVKLAKEMYYYTKTHKSLYGIKTFVFFLLPKKLKTKSRISEKTYINKKFVERVNKKETSSITEHLYASNSLVEALINHFEYKLEHLLKWNDRNSMAFSIESRTPFLDFRLVEFTLANSANNVINKGYTKSILRESLKNILPEKIRMRKDKIGFATPQDEWFRKPEFKILILDIINSESFKSRQIIDHKIANQLFNKHLNNEINIAKDIWKWIHLELWFRKFIDNK